MKLYYGGEKKAAKLQTGKDKLWQWVPFHCQSSTAFIKRSLTLFVIRPLSKEKYVNYRLFCIERESANGE